MAGRRRRPPKIERQEEVLEEGRGWRVSRIEARHGPLRETLESVAAESGCEPEGWRRFFEALDRIADAPRPARAVEAFLQDVLATYGLPPWRYGEAWRMEPDGTFERDDLSVRRPECEYVAHPAAVIRNEAHPARAAIEALFALHRAVERNDPGAAVRAGWQAGRLAALLGREAEILAGVGAIEGGREGSARANAASPPTEQRLAVWREALDVVRRSDGSLPHGTISKAAKELAGRFGTTEAAERRFAYDHAEELGLPRRRSRIATI